MTEAEKKARLDAVKNKAKEAKKEDWMDSPYWAKAKENMKKNAERNKKKK